MDRTIMDAMSHLSCIRALHLCSGEGIPPFWPEMLECCSEVVDLHLDMRYGTSWISPLVDLLKHVLSTRLKSLTLPRIKDTGLIPQVHAIYSLPGLASLQQMHCQVAGERPIDWAEQDVSIEDLITHGFVVDILRECRPGTFGSCDTFNLDSRSLRFKRM